MMEKKKKNKQANKENQDEIPKPKDDIRIEKDSPKFNSVLLGIINKKPNEKKDNEGTK